MIDNNTKIGTFSYFGFQLEFEERIKLISEASFDSTFVWLGPENDLIVEGRLNDIPKIVRDHNLYLESAHSSYIKCINIWSESSFDRNNRIEEYYKDIKFCSDFDIPILVIHITGSHLNTGPNKYGVDSIKRIIEIAKDYNVIMAAENARNPHFHDYIFSEIQSDYFKICYDSSHDFIRSDKPTDILQRWGNEIVATHFSDNDGVEDSHWPPTEGTIDWELIFQHFPKQSFSSSIMLESFPKDETSTTPKEYLKQLYQCGKWLRSKLIPLPDSNLKPVVHPKNYI